jgi:hypothetical protein
LPFHRKQIKTIEHPRPDDGKIVIRVLQGDNNYFVIHKNNIGKKLIKDIEAMLKPL